MEITPDVIKIIQKHSKSDEEVNMSSKIIQDLSLDSLQVMELIFDVESKFDISISINLLPEINTVGDLRDHIQSLLEEKA